MGFSRVQSSVGNNPTTPITSGPVNLTPSDNAIAKQQSDKRKKKDNRIWYSVFFHRNWYRNHSLNADMF